MEWFFLITKQVARPIKNRKKAPDKVVLKEKRVRERVCMHDKPNF